MYPKTTLLTCNQIISTGNSDHFKRANNCFHDLTFTMFLKKSLTSQKNYLP